MMLTKSKIDFDFLCDLEHKEYRPKDAPPPQVQNPLHPHMQAMPPQAHQGQQAPQKEDPVLAAVLQLQ